MSSSSNPGQKIQKDESYLQCLANYLPVYLLIFFGCCLQHQSRRLSSCFMSTSLCSSSWGWGGGGGHTRSAPLVLVEGSMQEGVGPFHVLQNIRIPLGPARGWKEWDKAECARQEVGGCVSARVHSSGYVAAAVSHVIHVDVCILPSPQKLSKEGIKAMQQCTTVLMHCRVKGSWHTAASHPIGAWPLTPPSASSWDFSSKTWDVHSGETDVLPSVSSSDQSGYPQETSGKLVSRNSAWVWGGQTQLEAMARNLAENCRNVWTSYEWDVEKWFQTSKSIRALCSTLATVQYLWLFGLFFLVFFATSADKLLFAVPW